MNETPNKCFPYSTPKNNPSKSSSIQVNHPVIEKQLFAFETSAFRSELGTKIFDENKMQIFLFHNLPTACRHVGIFFQFFVHCFRQSVVLFNAKSILTVRWHHMTAGPLLNEHANRHVRECL